MNVLIDMPVYTPLLDSLIQLPGINIELVTPPEERKRALPVQQIRDCDILFCTIPPENHSEMQSLKMIQISSTGYNQLVGQGFEDRGVKACNARGVFDVPIAEWNIAMMINLIRDMRGMIHNQDTQVWDRSSRFQREIRGSVVGIFGYGGIGRETARLAKAMGMTVHVLGRNPPKPRKDIYYVPGTGDMSGSLPDKFFSMDEKEEFLRGLDFLIMAIPQLKDTVGIIGENELKTLSPHAFLLNPARGPLVQEQALLTALQEGLIAGAALDTHYHYPMPPDHPLWSMTNVIMTPHISGSSSSTRFLERTWDVFLQNVKRFQRGEVLLNELTPLQLK